MAPFDECCVLLPSATLEDFPATASDSDACNILAAWTALWHPELLAQTGQLPTWYRADAPPDSDGPKVIIVPNLSVDQLPKGFKLKCDQNPDCNWVDQQTRDEMVAQIGVKSHNDLQTSARAVGVADFYAAGYASLQIQIMTRRLRYTSNLDELHLQGRAVAAAQAFIDGKAQEAVDALHDVFDCLAEERDHYFASDPHLIDLALLTPKTLASFVQNELPDAGSISQADGAPLATPANVLIDHAVATHMSESPCDDAKSICQAIVDKHLGWAGGAPNPKLALDTLSFADAEQAIVDGFELAKTAVGSAPKVFARFTGFTPNDMTPCLVRQNYDGMIPIDFAAGSGFGDEAKLIRQYGGSEIHALTAKPVDATSDASFLSIGARLGESIDSGEIATALMAHWPGQTCQGFQDLKRVATWSLALGKFWRMDDYFTDGEHPYHQSSSSAISSRSFDLLNDLVKDAEPNPISSVAAMTKAAVQKETLSRIGDLCNLVSGKPSADGPALNGDSAKNDSIATGFASAIGVKPSSDSKTAALIINPHQAGQRVSVSLTGHPPAKDQHIYASSANGSESTASIDVPAYGFASVVAGNQPAKKASLLKRLAGTQRMIADATALQNEFMEVQISPDTGALLGVYSGSGRGNRMSMRIARVAENNESFGVMKATEVRVVESSKAVGEIEVAGQLVDDKSDAVQCTFKLNYRLVRGSRFLQVSGSFDPTKPQHGQPWNNYLALRVAVVNEAAITRLIVRDKVHRSKSRKLVSPLGLIVDESERQTLIATSGLAFHRRSGDRLIDTLIDCQGETAREFSVSYGFDVSSPIANCKAVAAGGITEVPVKQESSLTSRGWILHAAPSDVTINSLKVRRRDDGLLAAHVRVIQTRAKAVNATIRFLRDVEFATILESQESWETPIPKETPDDAPIKTAGDKVRLSLAGHQVADLLIVFAKS